MKQITDKRVSVSVNASGAIEEVTRLGRAMRAIVDKRVTVHVDYTSSGTPPVIPPTPPPGSPRPTPPPGPGMGGGFGGRLDRLQQQGYYNMASGAMLTGFITRPVVNAAQDVIGAAGGFQETMQHLVTLTDVSKGSLEGLKKEVLDLSKDPIIRQGPTQLADGLYYVASTGLKGADAMKVLRASAIGASAGLGETKVVANTVTTVLDAYGLSADKAAKVTDTLTEAVRFGKGEADQFAGAFPKVIAIAAQAGVSFEEVAAQMASATRVGLTPSETATALRQIFNNLIDPSEKAMKAMKEMGTSVEELRLKLKGEGLFNTLKDLSERTGGRIGPITELFGSIRALTGFLSTTGTATLSEYKKTLDAINNSSGSSMQSAASASETFEFQLDKLRSTVESISIDLGTKYLPALTEFIKTTGQDAPNAVKALTRTWEDLPGPLQEALKYLGALVLLAGPFKLLAGNVMILSSVFGSFFNVFKAIPALNPILAPIAAFATNPYVLAVLAGTAIVGGIAAWVTYKNNLEAVRKEQNEVARSAKKMGEAFDRAIALTAESKIAQKAIEGVQGRAANVGNDPNKIREALDAVARARKTVIGAEIDPNAKHLALRRLDEIQAELDKKRLTVKLEIEGPASELAAKHVEDLRKAGFIPGTSTSNIEAGLADTLANTPGVQAGIKKEQQARALSREDERWEAKAKGEQKRQEDEQIAKIEARRKAADEKRKREELEKQKAADAEEKRKAQEEANAERLRAVEVRTLSQRITAWQNYGNVVEGILGRIQQLAEQGSVVDEKTAKARVQAQLLRREFDEIPTPLREAAVELAGIEAKLKEMIGLRDGLRGLFEGAFGQLTKSGADTSAFADQVRDLERQFSFNAKIDSLQAQARRRGIGLINQSEQARANLDSQREALQFAGKNSSEAFDGAANSFNAGGTVVQSVINQALHTPMGKMACARFVNWAFDAMGVAFRGSEMAATMEQQAAKVARKIPLSQAGAGDLLVGPGGGPSGRHVGIGIGNGMFAAKNNDRVGKISEYNFDSAYDTSALVRGASGASLGPVVNGLVALPGGGYTDPVTARQILGGNVTAPTGRTVPTITPALAPRSAGEIPLLPGDGRLNRLSNLPSGWGGNVASRRARPGEVRSNQELMEAFLMQQMAEGRSFTNGQLWGARQAMMTADIKLTTQQVQDAAAQSVMDMGREIRLIGREDNPIAALFEGFKSGANQFLNQPGRNALITMTTKKWISQASDATREMNRELAQRLGVERAVNPSATAGEQERQRFVAQARSDAENDKGIRDMFAAAEQLRRQGKVHEAKALSDTARSKVEQTVRGQVAEFDSQRTRERISEAADATRQFNSEMGTLLQQRAELARDGGAPESVIAERLQYLSDTESKYAELREKYGEEDSRRMAGDYAFHQAILRQLQREIDLQKEVGSLNRGTANTKAQTALLLRSGSMTPAARREMEMLRWRQEMADQGKNLQPGYATLEGAKEKSLDAQMEAERVGQYTSRLQELQREMATLGDKTGMAGVEFDLFKGQLSDLSPLQKATLMLAEASAAARRFGQESKDAAIEATASAMKEQELAQARTARQRLEIEFRYQDKERERNGKILDPASAAIEQRERDRQKEVADYSERLSDFQRTVRDFRDSIAQGISDGFDKGLEAGIGSFARGVLAMGRRALIEKWSGDLVGKIFGASGRDALGRDQYGINTKMPTLPAVLGGITGINGEPAFPLADRLHRDRALMTPPFAPQAIPQRPETGGLLGAVKGILGGGSGEVALNATTVNVRATFANVNGGSSGATISGSGSQPSGEQIVGRILGALG